MEKCNTEIDQRDFPSLSFKTVSIDHTYVHKRAPKEFQSVDGILKYSSLQKHYELLPSVVVLTAAYNVEWQTSEWTRLNENLFEKITKIRDQLKGREVKVVVVFLRLGTNQIASELLEERIGNLRRYLSLEIQRTFITIIVSDLIVQPLTIPMRKLSKIIRELSSSYYNLLEKRARFLMKTARIRGSNEGILTARYSFKLAFFLTFQGMKLQSLKYYRQCFESLLGSVLHVDEDLLDQLKTVAEYTNFKICSMLLQIGSVKEALAQFMIHITTFTKIFSIPEWKHFSWICDQYTVFLQTLDLHRVTNILLSTESFDRFFFLQNALKYSLKRQENFRLSQSLSDGNGNGNNGNGNENLTENEIKLRNQLSNLVVSAAKYVGARPYLIDPDLGSDSGLQLNGTKTLNSSNSNILNNPKNSNSNNNSDNSNNNNSNNNSNNLLRAMDYNEDPELFKKYLIEMEKLFDISNLIFKLFQRCDDFLTSSTIVNNRRKANLNCIISQQFILSGRYHEGLKMLKKASDLYTEENWKIPCLPLLRKILNCSILLGRPEEYIIAAIKLYSINSNENTGENKNNDGLGSGIGMGSGFYLDKHEKESLHSDILSIIKCNENYGFTPSLNTEIAEIPFIPNSTINSPNSLFSKLNYGIAASVDRPSQRSLPLHTTIGTFIIFYFLFFFIGNKELSINSN